MQVNYSIASTLPEETHWCCEMAVAAASAVADGRHTLLIRFCFDTRKSLVLHDCNCKHQITVDTGGSSVCPGLTRNTLILLHQVCGNRNIASTHSDSIILSIASLPVRLG